LKVRAGSVHMKLPDVGGAARSGSRGEALGAGSAGQTGVKNIHKMVHVGGRM
jgi:hypothetical protein